MITEFENYKILLVDDDPDSTEFIRYNLKKEGFKVYSVNNGIEAISRAREIIPHIILLDIMMPEMDGVETCEEIRKIHTLNKTIIAFLTARGEDYSQIAGFDAGGDDYITKPIKPKVLLSRIKALLKRYHSAEEAIVSARQVTSTKGFIIDNDRYVVVKDGNDIVLPKKEFELLTVLISRPEKVFTREEIFHSVWGDKIIVGDRTIDVHIRKLREKIGEEYIKTIKGVGYKFVG
ncbi:MAG: response regulator transcription factor [Deltaproteobacteria bacterium]|nr:response regulator transcription factor [Deltaproteobacteria bacterium]